MGSIQQPLEVISPSQNLHCYSKRHRRPNVRLAEIGDHSNESTKKDMSGYAIMSSESSANQGSGPADMSINETMPEGGEMDNISTERANEDQQIDKPNREIQTQKADEEHEIGKPSEEEMGEKKDGEQQIEKLGEEQKSDKLGEQQPGEEQQSEKLGEKQKIDKSPFQPRVHPLGSVEKRQIDKPGEWQIDKAGEEQQTDKPGEKCDIEEQVERADEDEKLNRPAEEENLKRAATEEHNHRASEELHSNLSIERVHELEADAVLNKEEQKQPFENVQTKANRTQIGYQRRNKRGLENSTLQKMTGVPESPRKTRMTLRADSKKSRDDGNASLSDVMNINSNDHNSDHQEEHVARDDWMEVSREVTSSKEIIRKSASPRVRKKTPRKARGGAKETKFVDRAVKDITGISDDEENLSNHEIVLEKAQNPGLAEGVVKWLNALGLIKYAENFEKHEVEDDVLPLLTFEDLREMGISAVGARRKMFTAIEEMEKKQLLKKL